MSSPQKSNRGREVNIRKDAVAILSLVEELSGAFSSTYIARLLQGNVMFGLKARHHLEMEQFGAMSQHQSYRIHLTIGLLVEMEYIEIKHQVYGTLGLLAKGSSFLKAPHDLRVLERCLRPNVLDLQLAEDLRQIRIQIAQKQSMKIYQVFTDYTLHKIVEAKPVNWSELVRIPGIGDYKANRYGPAIIQATAEAKSRAVASNRARMYKQANSPSHQAVKYLFQAGHSMEEIAELRKVRPATIQKSLVVLAEAGQINLGKWIQNHVEPSVLKRGAEYFQANPKEKLQEAFQQLGIDYDSLRLCKLYVSRMTSKITQLDLQVS
ncbi:HRDC domain-containing protein [Pontibacter sp. G13]|uniref:HRDC domain-containing protein n=1 Tax=Pontibacter sp. G13 TaxID=3074898 RepID=UPI00288AE32D|nr:HRDC domain-containing protein [Pontibacter sp. G13]WNJ16474.1 HRDC domain-containing protein [Pontibacter sp. G13]